MLDYQDYMSSGMKDQVAAARYRDLIKYHLLTYRLWPNDVDNPLIAAYSSKYNDYVSPDNCLQTIQEGQECYQLWYMKSTDIDDRDIFDFNQDVAVGRASLDSPLKNLGLFVRYNYKGVTKDSPQFTFRIMPSKSYIFPYDFNQTYACLVLGLSPTNLSDWSYNPALNTGNIYSYSYLGNWSCTLAGGCLANVTGKYCYK
jgi:hypothetical protein